MIGHSNIIGALFLTGSVLCSTGVASAVRPAHQRASAVVALGNCGALTKDAERLACYDKAGPALDQAERAGGLVVLDKQQINEVQHQAFGFRLPALDLFGPAKATVEQFADFDVETARRGADGRRTIVTRGGAVWEQKEADDGLRDPRKDSKLRVSHGLMGSFFCKIDAEPAVRCRRVD